jgi:hypothetical protein
MTPMMSAIRLDEALIASIVPATWPITWPPRSATCEAASMRAARARIPNSPNARA